MSILLVGDNPVGFITWYKENDRVAEIVIAEMQPGFRKKGYVRVLVDTLLNKLKEEGIYVVKLHCQPATSEKAWKKMNFIQFPEIEAFQNQNSRNGKHLYKILVPCAELVELKEDNEVMQLWSAERYEADTELPRWTWLLNFKDDQGNLTLPIIYPAKRKWHIRWTRSNNIIKEDGIKYFQRDELDFSEFLIIDHLNLPKAMV